MENFGEFVFTDAVAAYQKAEGVWDRNRKIYANRFLGDLSEDARNFITTRTSFYIASLNADGWPYIQHRGGPMGFLKILTPTRIGFADYHGNRQFITRGNLDDSARVSLFMMDYPRRARLKLLGTAQMVDAQADAELARQLADADGPEPERLVTIDIVAMDWNCPKYIEPRFTEAEIETMLGPRIEELTVRNRQLEAEVEQLRAKLEHSDDTG